MPWLLVVGDDFFEIFTEIFIQRDGRIPLPGFAQHIRNRPAAAMGQINHGNRAVILSLDNHLTTLPNFFQYVYIAG